MSVRRTAFHDTTIRQTGKWRRAALARFRETRIAERDAPGAGVAIEAADVRNGAVETHMTFCGPAGEMTGETASTPAPGAFRSRGGFVAKMTARAEFSQQRVGRGVTETAPAATCMTHCRLAEHGARRRNHPAPGVHPARRHALHVPGVAVAARGAGVRHVAGMGDQAAVCIVAPARRRVSRVTGGARRAGEVMTRGKTGGPLGVTGHAGLGGIRRRAQTDEHAAAQRHQQ